MSRTSRFLLYALTSIVVFLITSWIILTFIINPTFKTLEERLAYEQADRAYTGVKQHQDQLNAIVSDWAAWDAAYQFIMNNNQKFLDENLRDWNSVERDLHVNLIYMYDNSGNIVYGQSSYLSIKNGIDPPEIKTGTILNTSIVTKAVKERTRISGFIQTNYGLLIVSAAPIVKTDGKGERKGVMIFGRMLDNPSIDKLSNEIKTPFSIVFDTPGSLTEEESAALLQLKAGERKLVHHSENELNTYTPIFDIHGKSIGLIKTRITTDIAKLSREVAIETMVVLGVILAVFLALLIHNNNRRQSENIQHKNKLSAQVVGITVLGVLVSIGFSAMLYQKKKSAINEKFFKMAGAQIDAVQNKLKEDLTELYEIKRFFEGSETVSRSEFQRFVSPYLENRSFQAIEWIPLVRREQRALYEQIARQDGVESYRFTELDSAGKLIIAPPRDRYWPVYYVEPEEKNLKALNYAPVHLPMRNEAINKASTSGSASATAPFRLVQETTNQSGLMVFVPINKVLMLAVNGKSVTCDTSLAACVYRADDMIKNITHGDRLELLKTELLDVMNKPYRSLTAVEDASSIDSSLFIERSFNFAGRNYQVKIFGRQAFTDSVKDYDYLYVLFSGLLVTLFLSLYFHELLSQKERAEILVASRTEALRESENRYQVFIRQSTEGISRIELLPPVDITGTEEDFAENVYNNAVYAECNSVFVQQMGYNTTEEIVGGKMADIVQIGKDRLIAFYVQFYQSNFRLSDYELPYLNKLHIDKTLVLNISCVIEDGKLVRMWANQTDVTEKKNALQSLRESEAHFRTLAENSPEIISRVDRQYKHRYINSVVEEILGVPAHRIIGKTYAELGFNDEMLHDMTQAVDYVFAHKKMHRIELEVKRGLWIDWLLFPELGTDGEVTEVVTIARDITEFKNVEGELRKEKDRAEESDRLKSAFLANMSHEIRTPMNAIMGFSELLEDPELSEAEKSMFIQKLRRRTTDLLNLINDILDISKIEAEQIQLFEGEVDLRKLFIDLRDVFSGLQLVETKDIELILDCKVAEADSKVIIDATRLKQILINLINNAYKFTERGNIIVSCERQTPSTLVFSIEDTGIGIPPEKQDSIFDRFRQGDDESYSKKFGGTGLGLAIVKGLLENMGGSIKLESELGKGTVITIIFPFRSA